MTSVALQILESFDHLTDAEKKSVASEILRRTIRSEHQSPKLVGVGGFHSGRSDISAKAEDLMRQAAAERR